MADVDVVFVLGGQQVRLTHEEAVTLDDWVYWDTAVGVRESLRGPLRKAIKGGGEVVVPNNAVREAFLPILDEMAKASKIQTDGLRNLHRVAGQPIIGG